MESARRRRLETNDPRLPLDAARAGVGIALVPEMIGWAPVATGELVQVLDGIVGATTTLAVVYPERKLLAPTVRAFIDEAVIWAAKELPRMAERCTEDVGTTRAKTNAKAESTAKPGKPARKREAVVHA